LQKVKIVIDVTHNIIYKGIKTTVNKDVDMEGKPSKKYLDNFSSEMNDVLEGLIELKNAFLLRRLTYLTV